MVQMTTTLWRLLQANVTIVDVGRTAEGCTAYLSVGTVTVGQCQTTTTGLGSSASPGAQNWLLENVPGLPGYVYISNEVKAPAFLSERRGRRRLSICTTLRTANCLSSASLRATAGTSRSRVQHALPGSLHQLQRHRDGSVCPGQQCDPDLAADPRLSSSLKLAPHQHIMMIIQPSYNSNVISPRIRLQSAEFCLGSAPRRSACTECANRQSGCSASAPGGLCTAPPPSSSTAAERRCILLVALPHHCVSRFYYRCGSAVRTFRLALAEQSIVPAAIGVAAACSNYNSYSARAGAGRLVL